MGVGGVYCVLDSLNYPSAIFNHIICILVQRWYHIIVILQCFFYLLGSICNLNESEWQNVESLEQLQQESSDEEFYDAKGRP